MPTRPAPTPLALLVLPLLACNPEQLSSDEEAEYAYRGLDTLVSRALRLGLDGFNTASSANIDPQSEGGDVSGTLTVTGQVDQGASDNKGLRLALALVDYADLEDVDGDDDDDDEVAITYNTDAAAPPALDLQLRDMPDGTLSGTLTGLFLLDGDLEGEVTLNLSLEGTTEEDPGQTGYATRVEGTTTVTGTATNEGGGVYEVATTL